MSLRWILRSRGKVDAMTRGWLRGGNVRSEQLLIIPTELLTNREWLPGELLSGSERPRPGWFLDMKYHTCFPSSTHSHAFWMCHLCVCSSLPLWDIWYVYGVVFLHPQGNPLYTPPMSTAEDLGHTCYRQCIRFALDHTQHSMWSPLDSPWHCRQSPLTVAGPPLFQCFSSI